jgi:hypothetical protein
MCLSWSRMKNAAETPATAERTAAHSVKETNYRSSLTHILGGILY